MPRKANYFNVDNCPPEEIMSRTELEHYFSAIQQELVKINEHVNQVSERMDNMEETLKSILDIVRTYDIERKEIKSALWEHDRRLVKLERELANSINS